MRSSLWSWKHAVSHHNQQPIIETLICRVTLNLTGLPPTPDEVKAFIAAESATAYESLVDRLLASSAYGEHVAQYWLDLARYAETDGFEHDNLRPSAWRYRDWVIDALNADMPYDEFIRLQIAGDLLKPENESAPSRRSFVCPAPTCQTSIRRTNGDTRF